MISLSSFFSSSLQHGIPSLWYVTLSQKGLSSIEMQFHWFKAITLEPLSSSGWRNYKGTDGGWLL